MATWTRVVGGRGGDGKRPASRVPGFQTPAEGRASRISCRQQAEAVGLCACVLGVKKV